jgi:hypothetical protein
VVDVRADWVDEEVVEWVQVTKVVECDNSLFHLFANTSTANEHEDPGTMLHDDAKIFVFRRHIRTACEQIGSTWGLILVEGDEGKLVTGCTNASIQALEVILVLATRSMLEQFLQGGQVLRIGNIKGAMVAGVSPARHVTVNLTINLW